jgi:hypothetical protein
MLADDTVIGFYTLVVGGVSYEGAPAGAVCEAAARFMQPWPTTKV